MARFRFNPFKKEPLATAQEQAKDIGLSESKDVSPSPVAAAGKEAGLGGEWKSDGLKVVSPGEPAYKDTGFGGVAAKDAGLSESKDVSPTEPMYKDTGFGGVAAKGTDPGDVWKTDGLKLQSPDAGVKEPGFDGGAQDLTYEIKLTNGIVADEPAGKEMADLDSDEIVDLPSATVARQVYEPDDVLGIVREPYKRIVDEGPEVDVDRGFDVDQRLDAPDFDALDAPPIADDGLPTVDARLDATSPYLARADLQAPALVEVEMSDFGDDDPGWNEGADELAIEVDGASAGSLLDDDGPALDG